MEEEKLIYVNDCYLEEDFYVVSYENVATSLEYKTDEDHKVKISIDILDKDPKSYIDRFILFKKEFDIKENGFKNTKKGGHDSKARSLTSKLHHLNKKAKSDSLHFFEKNTDTIDDKKDWYVCIFNVGNGESNLLVAPDGGLYLFDGGCLNQNICNKIELAMNYLRCNNVYLDEEFRGFFISHCDGDHFRGVIEAMENLSTSKDCFVYYNYLSSYSKPSWINALERINNLKKQGKISKYVNIPERKDLGLMSSLIPSLNITWMWPFDYNETQCVSNNISSNDSSHCLYVSDKEGRFSINFFGDSERVAGENIIYDETKMINEFVFKPSHHGRESGNINLDDNFGSYMHDWFDSSSKVKFFISSTKENKHLTDIAKRKKLTGNVTTAMIVKFSQGKCSLIEI
jgi:beta-lactamase superfamily II metal-dependent hydrolase